MMPSPLLVPLLLSANINSANISTATTLLPGDLPLATKLDALRPFFKPAIGSTIEVDPEEEQGRKKRDHAVELKGYITVSPPKGRCLIIQRREGLPDDRVCSQKPLSFQVKDINGKGELVWLVKTGPEDFGSPVVWHTPYRIGRYADNTMPWPGASKAFVVESCTAIQSAMQGRLIKIELFHTKGWTLRLPAQDRLEMVIDRPKPRLYFQKKNLSSAPTEEKEKDKEAEKEAEKKAAPKEESEPKYNLFEAAAENEDWNTIKANWQSHPRDAYHVPADQFTVDAALPAGSNSRCHYKYEGFEQDPSIGLLECHDAGPFQWILLPLTCLPRLKPKGP